MQGINKRLLGSSNGLLKIRLYHSSVQHWPQEATGKKRCQLHRWARDRGGASVMKGVMKCSVCQVILCLTCYNLFHKETDFIAKINEISKNLGVLYRLSSSSEDGVVVGSTGHKSYKQLIVALLSMFKKFWIAFKCIQFNFGSIWCSFMSESKFCGHPWVPTSFTNKGIAQSRRVNSYRYRCLPPPDRTV